MLFISLLFYKIAPEDCLGKDIQSEFYCNHTVDVYKNLQVHPIVPSRKSSYNIPPYL